MPTSNKKREVIIGIDPGYADCGYGVIEKNGPSLSYITCDTIKSSSKLPFEQRLKTLHYELTRIIKKYKPHTLSIEKIFFFKNKKTVIDVAQSRGVVLLVAAEHNIPVVEYTPPQIKQSLTSHGQATKTQVEYMVKTLLNQQDLKKNDDAIDALAIAICASFRDQIL